MAKSPKPDQPLMPSILDRLIDDEPAQQHELQKSRTQVLRELKWSVQRDLQNLLNTRWRCSSFPPTLEELERSLVNYGIPDFTGANLGSTEHREEFRRLVETIIRHYEPRFKSVSVQLVDSAQSQDRTLRFRIEALLWAEPAPEPVTFDSMLEPVSGNFELKGQSR